MTLTEGPPASGVGERVGIKTRIGASATPGLLVNPLAYRTPQVHGLSANNDAPRLRQRSQYWTNLFRRKRAATSHRLRSPSDDTARGRPSKGNQLFLRWAAAFACGVRRARSRARAFPFARRTAATSSQPNAGVDFRFLARATGLLIDFEDNSNGLAGSSDVSGTVYVDYRRSARPQSSGLPWTPERGAHASRERLMFSPTAASALSPS